MGLKDLLYRAPAWALLLLPFLAAAIIFLLVLSLFPEELVGRYLVFAFVFFSILLSRMLRVWEWGVEAFHFLTFCITFAYGFVFGAILTVGMSAIVMYLLLSVRAHYFTYGTTSILIQSTGLLVNVALSAALSSLLPAAALSNLPYFGTGVVFVALFVDKSLTHRFVGLDWGRLSVSTLVGLVVNYNLFSLFGAGAIEFFSGL